MSQITHFNSAVLNPSSSGDNTIVSSPAAGPIKVWKVFFTVAGAVNVTFKSGTTALSGAYQLTGAGSSFLLYYDGSPHYIALPGQNLVMNLSGAVALAGTIWYTIGG